ncbi:MAG: DUF3467 domain-containing protein [Paludibacteraceae bacterium]|nr:DUF3467 domain-containing protein [Paludibacteraceae bacterium]
MDEKETEQKKNELQIEMSPEIAEGAYANMTIVTHSPSEFVLDFVRILPNLPKAKVKSRIILTPSQAKRLRDVLQRQINIYEANNGIITDNQPNNGGNTPTPISFGNSGMA